MPRTIERQRLAAAAGRKRNRSFVNRTRAETRCAMCGDQPIDWHREEHRNHPRWRIADLATQPASIARIEAEIAHCEPLCRRCHMLHDGRATALVARNRATGKRGESNHRAKLTWPQVEEIRRLYPGRSMGALARAFSVSHSTVSRIVHERAWIPGGGGPTPPAPGAGRKPLSEHLGALYGDS
jgi:hypothetical protein